MPKPSYCRYCNEKIIENSSGKWIRLNTPSHLCSWYCPVNDDHEPR